MVSRTDTLKILLFILLFSTLKYKAQDYSFFPETIKKTAEYSNRGELSGAMNYNINALGKYKKLNDKENIATVYINISYLLFLLNKTDEGLKYLDLAKEEMKGLKNPLLEARLYNEYAKISTRLSLTEQSNLEFDKAIRYALKVPDEKQKNYLLFYSYTWKRLNFLNKKDSLISLEKKSLKYMPSGITYTKIADRFIQDGKHLDSADYYLKKARIAPDSNIVAVRGLIWFSYGNLYNVQKDHKKALEYYLKSLQTFEKIKFKAQIRKSFDSLSSTYDYLNDHQNANLYFKKYKLINDTIKKDEKKAVNIVVERLMLAKEREEKNKRNYLYFFIFIIVGFSVTAFYVVRRKYQKKQKQKNELIQEMTSETDQLKKKVGGSYREIIQLAESRSPFFLTRFKQVYPEFCEKLILHCPELSEHDIKFCAYIKLNLTNKEIVLFENITVRGVETKKYRLKKKLNLSADTDLNKWLMEL
ncbi:tetratricopeptide repeat protein [Chryseobacterium indologenes]|uniref:Tetratricopeptide repeat protein n=1 Tax=Chryseobacterium indologenes TaxID=253 RepID=A0A411DKV4_CHRID|nr:tetratricopeptide repeat protein [Chryseobacterium indologenes]